MCAGALDARAGEVYSSLSEPGRVAARQRVPPARRGGRAGGRRLGARPPSPSSTSTGDGAAECIEGFGASRLLSFDSDPRTGAPTVEIAHDALIVEWERLRDWIDAARDDIRAAPPAVDAGRRVAGGWPRPELPPARNAALPVRDMGHRVGPRPDRARTRVPRARASPIGKPSAPKTGAPGPAGRARAACDASAPCARRRARRRGRRRRRAHPRTPSTRATARSSRRGSRPHGSWRRPRWRTWTSTRS